MNGDREAVEADGMKHLRESQVAQMLRKLMFRERELREKIRDELARSEEDHRDAAAGDAGDESVAGATADLDAAMMDRHMRELAELEAARGRLKAGTYGICLDCGGDIPWQRLLAYPVSERCVSCAQQHEHTYAHESTPSL